MAYDNLITVLWTVPIIGSKGTEKYFLQRHQYEVSGETTMEVNCEVCPIDKKTITYENVIVPIPFEHVVGDEYGGGIIGYILQIGDNGYDSLRTKGFIITPIEYDNGLLWGPNIDYSLINSTEIGEGFHNTNEIYNLTLGQSNVMNAIRTYNINGYTDWFLPSKDEFLCIYQNISLLQNYFGLFNYWTSSQYDINNAMSIDINTGIISNHVKSSPYFSKAIRYFDVESSEIIQQEVITYTHKTKTIPHWKINIDGEEFLLDKDNAQFEGREREDWETDFRIAIEKKPWEQPRNYNEVYKQVYGIDRQLASGRQDNGYDVWKQIPKK